VSLRVHFGVLAAVRAQRASGRETRAMRLSEVTREIEHLLGAVAAGLLSPTLKIRLEAAEAERAGLLVAEGGSAASRVGEVLPRLADTYRTMVENLEQVPPRFVDRARTTLKGLIGEIRLVPEGGGLTAEFDLQADRPLTAADTKISVVAGARFGIITHTLVIPARRRAA
jgi:hypothetical protein